MATTVLILSADLNPPSSAGWPSSYRLKKGTKIEYEGPPEQVYNFYLNGVRTENRGGQLKNIIAADLKARKSKSILKK